MYFARTRIVTGAALFACPAAACLFVMGCCSGPSFLSFGIGDAGSSLSLNWGERGPAQGSLITMDYDEGRSLAGEPLEFYFDGSPVEVPVTMAFRDNSTLNGCGFSHTRTYDLSRLPPGDYTVVHRRASGTGDPVNCVECPWEDFEGEEALVMVMERSVMER